MDLSTCLVGAVNPLVLPWKDNQVTSRAGFGVDRGIAVEVGQPQQFFSLAVDAYNGNSWLASPDICDGTNNYSCIASLGGVYSPGANALTSNNLANWNGSASPDVTEVANVSYIFYNDVWEVGKYEVPGMPFFTYIETTSRVSQESTLSLGQNSSFLDAIVNASIAPTKSWSLWPGKRTIGSQIDGSLILGGYDADRVDGDFSTKIPIQQGLLFTSITTMSWKSSNGTATNLLPPSFTNLYASLDPSNYRLQIPTVSKDTFFNATGATPNITATGTYYSYPGGPPDGAMTITLDNGFSVDIPGSDLVSVASVYNDNGVLAQDPSHNTSYAWLTSAGGQYDDNVFLGLPFLEQTVLIVNQAEQAFYLAQAHKADLGSPTNVKALCTGGPTATSTPTPATTTPAASGGHHSNAAGIGGGVGGGVAALLILGVLAFCWRRRRNSKEGTSAPDELGQPAMAQTVAAPAREDTASPPPKYPQVYEVYSPTKEDRPTDRASTTLAPSSPGSEPSRFSYHDNLNSELYYPSGKHEVAQLDTQAPVAHEIGSSR